MRKVIYPVPNPALALDQFDALELLERVSYDDQGRTHLDGVLTPPYLQGTIEVPDDATKEEIVELIQQRGWTIDDAIADASDQGVDDETG